MKALRKYDGLELIFDARTVLLQGKKPRNRQLVRMLDMHAGSYEDASEVVFYGEHPFQWVPTEYVENLLQQQEPRFILASVEDAEDFYYGN